MTSFDNKSSRLGRSSTLGALCITLTLAQPGVQAQDDALSAVSALEEVVRSLSMLNQPLGSLGSW